MTEIKLNNEELVIESTELLLRVAIIEGDISINNELNLPKGELLYYVDKAVVKGTGIVKYE